MNRMGASQSTQIQGATDAQKERVGVFSLRGTQKHTLEILATLLDQLLRENNLFNLSAMLGSPERCKELFVILSSTLRKEFKTLRLPDPEHPGELHAVSYITKDAYKILESETARKKLCDDIAWFIIRIVTLVAALTASVARNQEMILLTSDAASGATALTMNPRFMNPKMALDNRESISEDTMKNLKGATYVVVPGTTTKDPRDLFYFDGLGSVVVDARRRIVYMPLGSETRVMEIRFDQQPDYVRAPVAIPAYAQAAPYVQPPRNNAVEQARRFAAADQQRRAEAAVAANQQRRVEAAFEAQRRAEQPSAPASVSGSSTSTVPLGFGETYTQTTKPDSLASRVFMAAPRPVARRNSRTHRKGPNGRKATRKARKQRGGEGEVFFLVTLKDSICSDTTECEVVKFYMDSNGQTMDTETYRAFQSRTMGGLPQTMSFTDRVKPILEKAGVKKVPLEPPTEQQISLKTQFSALFNMSVKTLGMDTFNMLSDVKKNILSATEGASPAQYRAFLLASNIDSENFLQTLFCNDRWSSLRGADGVSGRTTNVVSYALLNALYYDRQEGSMETLTASECASKVAEFIGAKTLASAAQTGSPVLTFENAKFVDIPPALKAFGEQINATKKGARRTRSTEDKAILMDAHKQLRLLYDDQIKAVVDIIRKVMLPKNAGYGKLPLLVLSETFATDTRGTLVLLEEIVKEARNLLANHYLAVEKVYRNALSKLKERVEGVYTPNMKSNMPKTVEKPMNL